MSLNFKRVILIRYSDHDVAERENLAIHPQIEKK